KAAAAGAGKGAAPAAAPPAQAAKPAAAAAPATQASAAPQPALPAPPRTATQEHAPAAPRTNGHGRIFASPLARRLAKEASLDIARIAGSGPHGRVIARDVEQAKAGGALRAPAAAPGVAVPVQAPSDEKIRALFEPGSYEVVPHDNMRRIIAQRL